MRYPVEESGFRHGFNAVNRAQVLSKTLKKLEIPFLSGEILSQKSADGHSGDPQYSCCAAQPGLNPVWVQE